MKEELIVSAVAFLQDPNVANSPLAKKIEFLESKGLAENEIEEALKRAKNQGTVANNSNTTSSIHNNVAGGSSVVSAAPLDYYNVAPVVPDRTWKDYFIMATATAGVTYGLYQVVAKYLIPSIIPPTQSSIDKDKAKIDEEFIKIDKILEQLALDQSQIKENNETKLEEIDTVIENINDFLSKYNKDKLKFDDDLRLMKLEIDNLSNSLEKNLAGTKENLADELAEIGVELQSLKSLVKSRGAVQNGNGVATEARKIVPVSSIPSASEILKRAKNKVDEATKTHAAPATSTSPKTESPSTPDAPVESASEPATEASVLSGIFSAPAEPTTFGGITAGGIPQWQIQDQLREQEAELAAQKAASKPSEEDTVKKAIEKVGVPSWQLNSTLSAIAEQEKKPEEKKPEEKKADAGIPAWQLSSPPTM